MLTLAEFLLARIAEDEAAARAVVEDQRLGWFDEDGPYPGTRWQSSGGWEHNHLSDPASMFTRHVSPERVLAECEAKRRIVKRHDVVDVTGDCAFCIEPAPCEHLRILALPYADRPDYREEWKP